jgi:Branched-chain amino acid transport protein (AzlD)
VRPEQPAEPTRDERLRAGLRAGAGGGRPRELLAPALLAALVVTQTFAHGHTLHAGANTIGVAAGGLVAWRMRSIVACVVVAAVLTAALRAV